MTSSPPSPSRPVRRKRIASPVPVKRALELRVENDPVQEFDEDGMPIVTSVEARSGPAAVLQKIWDLGAWILSLAVLVIGVLIWMVMLLVEVASQFVLWCLRRYVIHLL
eukprot:TRINITY_DN31681_c0_g1_i1.p1 TRINITY_DN31681_c0_g1~~TRINITY_DN31681_c0_g1_i1.p1  ORF type:complete len:109 (+),score=8.36 TRINITY_DN31681_c0_g1_i1:86-412(+)